ncbi:MAG: hypothetical protein JF616_22055 [Fibrobacteres bacterium]|nr:hypothetical protein [Fibrobacterota bacterium]
MASKNPGGAPGIGKRWPYKALNFLSERRMWEYLRGKSGAGPGEKPFRLGEALTGCKRILLALPDGLQENLVAFPVVRSLVRERPDTVFLFLANQQLTAFLAALYGHDQTIGIRQDELYWGEPHFLELRRVAEEFRPDVSINLRESTPPLLHFILRAARAPIRVQANGDAPEGFANVVLRPSEPSNLLRRFSQAAALWDAAESPIAVKWARLTPAPGNIKDARSRLESEGLRPEATRLFLWQYGNSLREHALFRKIAADPAERSEGRSLLIVSIAGSLFQTPPPPPDLTAGFPAQRIDSTGTMLGLFASTRSSIGVNGPLLHLASLGDTDVEAHFGGEDRAWDTSALNGRMRIIYEEPQAEAAGSHSLRI